MATSVDDSSTWEALQTGCVLAPHTRPWVCVKGPDASAFLHRLTTQAVDTLAVGEARLNTLLNKQGRIVDLVFHIQVAAQEVWLIGTAATGPALLEWLDGFLFVEQVTLQDRSEDTQFLGVTGQMAHDMIERCFGFPPPREPWGFVEQDGVAVLRGFDGVDRAGNALPGYVVFSTEAGGVPLGDRLGQAGAVVGDAAVLEAVRVATGTPGPGAELHDRMNPLELALHDAISWRKGCYIGQEVIARIDNYGKQARFVLGLVTDDPRPLQAGDRVMAGEDDLGQVTSVARYPIDDLPTALCTVRGKDVAVGQAVAVHTASGVIGGLLVARRAAQTPHD